MNKIARFLTITIASLGVIMGAISQCHAQEKVETPVVKEEAKPEGKNFAGVIPFATPGGFLGFFDQKDGKIYMYDSELSECTFVGQLEELGKSIKGKQAIPSDKVNETYKIPTVK